MPEVDTSRWRNAYDCLDAMKSNESPASIYKLLVRSTDAAELTWILAALSPWAPFGAPPPTKVGYKRSLPYATLAAREGIKANNRVCDVVTGAFRHIDEITRLKDAVLTMESHIYERDKLGMAIRRWDASGGQWKLHVILAILVESMKIDATTGMVVPFRFGLRVTNCLVGYEAFLTQWQQLLDHIVDVGVLEAATCKRIIDGKQLSKELGAKPGIWMTSALDVVMAWQFRNPTVTDPRGAIEEVRVRAAELNIPIK